MAESAKVEELLKAKLDDKALTIKWKHSTDRQTHDFVVENIERQTKTGNLVLSWDGDALDVFMRGKREIEVPTLKGKASLKIPAGTQSNTIFRMKGLGIPDLHSHHVGDENVEVYITVPEKLTKKQKQILEEFEKENKGKGFLKGVFG